MQVFISWSGATSQEVARALFEWLPQVIQSIEPYFSAQSIEKGTRGLNDIAGKLEEAKFGILCLTKDNHSSPWINFEAGALSKYLSESRVAPFLFDMAFSDIPGGSPVTQFQVTFSNKKEDVLALLQSLNTANEVKLTDDRLKAAFEKWWPNFEERISKISKAMKPVDAGKKVDKDAHIFEILDQILRLSRQQSNILRSPSDLLPPEYLGEIVSAVVHHKNNLYTSIPVSAWGVSAGGGFGGGSGSGTSFGFGGDSASGAGFSDGRGLSAVGGIPTFSGSGLGILDDLSPVTLTPQGVTSNLHAFSTGTAGQVKKKE